VNKYIWLTKHKGIEMNTYTGLKHMVFVFDVRCTRNTDHAGIEFRIGALGYMFDICLYDGRHWDYETDTWKVYEEK
jgi:hypothetical protein